MKLIAKSTVVELSFEEVDLVVGGNIQSEFANYQTLNVEYDAYGDSTYLRPKPKKPEKRNSPQQNLTLG